METPRPKGNQSDDWPVVWVDDLRDDGISRDVEFHARTNGLDSRTGFQSSMVYIREVDKNGVALVIRRAISKEVYELAQIAQRADWKVVEDTRLKAVVQRLADLDWEIT